MAWMLQPKSFYQAMRPNFYTVAYRRSGAYKGMGSLGQDTSTTTIMSSGGYYGPPTEVGTGGSTVVAVNPFGLDLPATPPTQPAPATPSLLIPGLLFVLVIALAGGRR